jgi:5S rRNA maturation endonuclease (ribonuclease M5)
VRAGEYVASRGGRSVVLTDWDDRGDRLAERLEEVLGKSPEDTDFTIRSKLRHLCRMYIKDIESLDTFVFGLRAKSI